MTASDPKQPSAHSGANRCHLNNRRQLRFKKYYCMGPSALVVFLSLFVSAPSMAETKIELTNIEIPDGYESFREENLYVRFGDGISTLVETRPDHEYSDSFLEDWFFDGAVAYMGVSSMPIPDGVSTALEAHQSLSADLEARWGKYSFSIYDAESGISRFVNYAGAFVAISWRKAGEELVVVESMDLVEYLIVEPVDLPASSDSEVLWQHFRKAANAKDVDAVLNSLGIDDIHP